MAFAMDTLDDTEWDVVIAGTGIQQSLLALALSRSSRKVLHIDKNNYYGGAEAAFSLQEAEEWVDQVNQEGGSLYFSNVSITRPDPANNGPKLSFPRAYSLALAPQIIYNRSKLLLYLISSRADKSLEFLAMGSWWIYSDKSDSGSAVATVSGNGSQRGEHDAGGSLLRIPTNREDVAFSDSGVDIRGKRALMRVLRFVMDYENQNEIWKPYSSQPLTDLLSQHFKLAPSLHHIFLALSVAPDQASAQTSYALPRIALHLRSIGSFGPGFSSVIPKWGGISEIAQNACRAGAVGGGVYVLGKGLVGSSPTSAEADASSAMLELSGGETVKSKWIAGTEEDLASLRGQPSRDDIGPQDSVARSISIVSSTLESLFPPPAEGSYPPAGATIVFPSGTLPSSEDISIQSKIPPPVYLIIHNADTGECPNGQCVIYASAAVNNLAAGQAYLDSAISAVLRTQATDSMQPRILWTLRYQQVEPSSQANRTEPTSPGQLDANDPHILTFPSPSLDLVFDDTIFENVKKAWRLIMGDEANDDEFLRFPDREAGGGDDEE